MEKLTKENIYIDLRGKSKEELTELWEFLTSNGEKCYRDKECFSETNIQYRCLHLYYGLWGGYDDDKVNDKTEVTIEQLKEILQPMENTEFNLKGYSVEVDNEVQAKQLQELAFKQGFKWYNGNKIECLDKKFFNFNAFNEDKIHYDTKHFKDKYVTKEIHFNDIFKTEENLEQQLQKAEAEVKRLKDLINAKDELKRIQKLIESLENES